MNIVNALKSIPNSIESVLLQGYSLGSNITVVLEDCLFIHNTVGTENINGDGHLQGHPNSGGGALSINGERKSVVCTRTNFIGNRGGNGGAILAYDRPFLTFLYFNMSGNSALRGGAIACINFAVTTWGIGVFGDNTGQQGGAVYLAGNYLTYTDNIEHYRQKLRPTFDVSLTQFSRNQAVLGGGAVHISGYFFASKNCVFDSNMVQSSALGITGNGGGLRVRSRGLVILNNTKIISSKAELGGGISLEDSILIGHNLSLSRNYASDVGSAISARFSPDFTIGNPVILECHDCVFNGNQAERAGEKNSTRM